MNANVHRTFLKGMHNVGCTAKKCNKTRRVGFTAKKCNKTRRVGMITIIVRLSGAAKQKTISVNITDKSGYTVLMLTG